MCSFCPDTAHDALGHYAVTCRHGGGGGGGGMSSLTSVVMPT